MGKVGCISIDIQPSLLHVLVSYISAPHLPLSTVHRALGHRKEETAVLELRWPDGNDYTAHEESLLRDQRKQHLGKAS